ncbi:succinate dehydrogenase cytochrome b subunit [Polyangium mundeleinium]|uniref:Succinate dehydrogenase cytochrome b subunit n=1 Tax=Polyangium mundeleinium TaxID=2995306 RepID=A0ABT5F603_9BACT|nr:succinate dehydrogenase cytochrome b subunit [Polyangium mundeleinium]MDC0749024.1 succinate dehydrogenase cytochrome b subunit [Polyangium mundeleinium]
MAATVKLGATSVAKKALMAASGVVLTGYVVLHLAGNLLYFAGPEALDAYGALLHKNPALLWSARTVLFASFCVHVFVALDLYMRRQVARPISYGRYERAASSLGARTMLWTGLILLGFVVYHVLHLTLGFFLPAYSPGRVHSNVSAAFSSIMPTVIYVLSMIALGLHVSHGTLAMTQSLGLTLRRDRLRGLRRFAAALAWIVAVGLAAIPITALTLSLLRGR